MEREYISNIQADTHQGIYSEIQTSQPNFFSGLPIETLFIWGGATVCFFAIWLSSLLIICKIFKITPDNQNLLPRKTSKKYPCHNCQYFNSNNFLKCAVHPSTVLTEEAKDCSDYCAHQSKLKK